MPTIEVKGLEQAADNLVKFSEDVRGTILRQSLRAAAWTIAEPARAATYSTFQRRTGFIKSGFVVRVGNAVKGDTMSATIAQKPQTIMGNAPTTKLFRQSVLRASKRSKRVELDHVAFYWRFLEFGTNDRRSTRMPKQQRRRRDEQKALDRFLSSHSTGRVSARPWVRPVFESTGAQSVDAFAETMSKATDQTVNAYPK